MRVKPSIERLDERIDLGIGSRRKESSFSFATAVSIGVHVLLLILFIRAHQTVPEIEKTTPIARYVELIRANPKEFVEAPGPAVDRAPLTAPYSNANRRASIPKPTGDQPTNRPGDGGGLYTPPARANVAPAEAGSTPAALNEASLVPAAVNWRSAIQEVGKLASLGGTDAIDLNGGGGEKGFAEAGPLSFETQWYNWGDYAQSMISRIRVNWYSVMPQIIRTGMSGVVTIRFTIHRDGRISDVTMISSSAIPPYDFAARKALELSSPLNPLPKDFPNAFERVTAMFYYNRKPPE